MHVRKYLVFHEFSYDFIISGCTDPWVCYTLTAAIVGPAELSGSGRVNKFVFSRLKFQFRCIPEDNRE